MSRQMLLVAVISVAVLLAGVLAYEYLIDVCQPTGAATQSVRSVSVNQKDEDSGLESSASEDALFLDSPSIVSIQSNRIGLADNSAVFRFDVKGWQQRSDVPEIALSISKQAQGSVTPEDSDSLESHWHQTDKSLTIQLEDIPDGTYRIVFKSDECFLPSPQTIEIQSGRREFNVSGLAPANLKLLPDPVDALASGPVDVTIGLDAPRIVELSGKASEPIAITLDGRFTLNSRMSELGIELSKVRPGTPITVRISDPRFTPIMIEIPGIPAGERAEYVVPLVRIGFLTGTLVMPNGEPVGLASLRLLLSVESLHAPDRLIEANSSMKVSGFEQAWAGKSSVYGDFRIPLPNAIESRMRVEKTERNRDQVTLVHATMKIPKTSVGESLYWGATRLPGANLEVTFVPRGIAMPMDLSISVGKFGVEGVVDIEHSGLASVEMLGASRLSLVGIPTGSVRITYSSIEASLLGCEQDFDVFDGQENKVTVYLYGTNSPSVKRRVALNIQGRPFTRILAAAALIASSHSGSIAPVTGYMPVEPNGWLTPSSGFLTLRIPSGTHDFYVLTDSGMFMGPVNVLDDQNEVAVELVDKPRRRQVKIVKDGVPIIGAKVSWHWTRAHAFGGSGVLETATTNASGIAEFVGIPSSIQPWISVKPAGGETRSFQLLDATVGESASIQVLELDK